MCARDWLGDVTALAERESWLPGPGPGPGAGRVIWRRVRGVSAGGEAVRLQIAGSIGHRPGRPVHAVIARKGAVEPTAAGHGRRYLSHHQVSKNLTSWFQLIFDNQLTYC